MAQKDTAPKRAKKDAKGPETLAWAQKLSRAIASRGLDKDDVAEHAEVSHSSMVSYLNGTRRPSKDACARLRTAIGCDEGELPDPPRAISRPKEQQPGTNAFAVELSGRLKPAMEERRMGPKALADRCDINAQMVSRYVLGQREPRASTLVRLCHGLDMSADELLGLDKEPWAVEHAIKVLRDNPGALTEQQRYDVAAILSAAEEEPKRTGIE